MKKICMYCGQEYDENRSGTLMRIKMCGETYCQGCDEPRRVSEHLITNFHGDVVVRSVDGIPCVRFETGCKRCAAKWEEAGVPVLLREGSA